MFRKIVSALATIIIIACVTSAIFTVREVSVGLQSGPVHNLNTGLDYLTIQAAIDAPETLDGHTILVDPGTYEESVVVTKSLYLIGTDKDTTTITGANVAAHNVTMTKFTVEHRVYIDGYNNFTLTYAKIENSTISPGEMSCIYLRNSNNSIVRKDEIYNVPGSCRGIYVWESDFGIIEDNVITCTIFNDPGIGSSFGVAIERSNFSTIESNMITCGISDSIGIFDAEGHNNTIKGNIVLSDPLMFYYTHGMIIGRTSYDLTIENTIINTAVSIWLVGPSSENVFYHNNFIDCYADATGDVSNTKWDYGYPSGGNYYSFKAGKDSHIGPSQDTPGKDAIGDIPYSFASNRILDHYPLMFPWPWEIKAIDLAYDSKTQEIGTVGNGHLSGFSFDWSLQQLSFSATTNTNSFCIVSIPKQLLDGGFQLLINDTIEPCILMWNSTHVSIYFEYGSGAINVKILGERVTPILGDINGDHIVDIFDAILLANHYNEHYP